MNRKSLLHTFIIILFLSLVFIPNFTYAKKKPKTKTLTATVSDPLKASELKIGRTKVIVNNKNGAYIKFTAPEKGNYEFVFSDVNAVRKKDKKSNSINGYAMLYKKLYNEGYVNLVSYDAKTNYGKSSMINVCSQKFYKTYKGYTSKYDQKKPTAYKTKRYAKMDLEQGEEVVMEMFFAGVKNSKASVLVNIKKK